MIIEKNKVVTICYALAQGGNVLKEVDTPFRFIFGNGTMPKMFEDNIEGLELGLAFQATLASENVGNATNQPFQLQMTGLVMDVEDYDSGRDSGLRDLPQLKILSTNIGKYIGDVKDNMFHGGGIMFYNNDTLYAGEWERGLFSGDGYFLDANGDSFEGFWKGGNISGKGTLTLDNGTVINGEWRVNCVGGQLSPVKLLIKEIERLQIAKRHEEQKRAVEERKRLAEAERLKALRKAAEEEKLKRLKSELLSAADDEIECFKVESLKKFGFRYKRQIIIQPKYENCGKDNKFVGGLALVCINNKYGFINKLDEVVVPLKYEVAFLFQHGLSRVRLNNKYGYIDKTGKVVIPLIYDYVKNYDIRTNTVVVSKNYKRGCVDRAGKTIIPIEYHDVDYFYEGVARVKLDKKYGFVDTSGNIIVKPSYEHVSRLANGLARVKENGKFGYIDKTGKVVIPIKYLKADEVFYGGYSAVKIKTLFGEKSGWIDDKEKWYKKVDRVERLNLSTDDF